MIAQRPVEDQMSVARNAMQHYDIALSVLAKGEDSPGMTDDLRSRLDKASAHITKYDKTERA